MLRIECPAGVWLYDEFIGLDLSEVVARETRRRQSEKIWMEEEC